ncbi:MAG: Asp-tRNA(Asn)/Glu-tRNA(Gln) amidotransferase subunit GatC [Candidatus Berkelbacteria bacterium]|nr:Asp-tRNA(Asn)/Glu-tRNA(Gln) amidotransferase subunit GatC [Candidatus Berkelbacteria bacterium]
MPKLSKDEVEHIAKLSRLALTDKEKEKFREQISSILDYVKELDKVDTKNTEPIANITGLTDIVREDEIKPSMSREKLLKNAPAKENGYIKVKRVKE